MVGLEQELERFDWIGEMIDWKPIRRSRGPVNACKEGAAYHPQCGGHYDQTHFNALGRSSARKRGMKRPSLGFREYVRRLGTTA